MKTGYHLLTDEQREIREMVRDFADREIIPTCKELEREGIFPKELYHKAFEMGLTTFILPEKYGGIFLLTPSSKKNLPGVMQAFPAMSLAPIWGLSP